MYLLVSSGFSFKPASSSSSSSLTQFSQKWVRRKVVVWHSKKSKQQYFHVFMDCATLHPCLVQLYYCATLWPCIVQLFVFCNFMSMYCVAMYIVQCISRSNNASTLKSHNPWTPKLHNAWTLFTMQSPINYTMHIHKSPTMHGHKSPTMHGHKIPTIHDGH